MKLVRNLCVVLASLLALCSSCTVGTSETKTLGANFFPQVGGMNLMGDEKVFPACLEKEQTLVIVAFERWQQAWVDDWYASIEEEMKLNDNLAYYEVPTIAKMNGMVRWWIYKGMRSGIQDEKMRSQVITLHIDKKPFKDLLSITDEKITHVFLLDKDGRILHREDGQFSTEKWLRLKESLEKKNEVKK